MVTYLQVMGRNEFVGRKPLSVRDVVRVAMVEEALAWSVHHHDTAKSVSQPLSFDVIFKMKRYARLRTICRAKNEAIGRNAARTETTQQVLLGLFMTIKYFNDRP